MKKDRSPENEALGAQKLFLDFPIPRLPTLSPIKRISVPGKNHQGFHKWQHQYNADDWILVTLPLEPGLLATEILIPLHDFTELSS